MAADWGGIAKAVSVLACVEAEAAGLHSLLYGRRCNGFAGGGFYVYIYL